MSIGSPAPSSSLAVTDHKRGLSVAATGGFLLACDIPLVRLAETDPWTTLMIRGPLVVVLFFIISQILLRKGWSRAKFYEGRETLIFAGFHTVGTICFVNGIFYTTTANLVFITAFSPLIALVLTTVLFKERHALSTWLTVAVALSGVLLITIDDFLINGSKNAFGNASAMLCAFILACNMIYARRCRKNVVYAPAFSGLLSGAIATIFVLSDGVVLGRPEYLLVNATLVAPLAMALMTLAPRYIPGPEAAMFFLLETVFAPLFVWVIFSEVPTTNTLLGGLIVISAIVLHSVRQIRKQSQRGVV